jgi:hypothetical protein
MTAERRDGAEPAPRRRTAAPIAAGDPDALRLGSATAVERGWEKFSG